MSTRDELAQAKQSLRVALDRHDWLEERFERLMAAHKKIRISRACERERAEEYRAVIFRQRSTINAQAKLIGTTPLQMLETPWSPLAPSRLAAIAKAADAEPEGHA